VQRSFEDTEDSSGSGTLAAAVSYPAGRWLADLKERRSEPLWHRGLPPIDGAALYSTGAQMNHSCVPNVDYTWSLRTSSCSSAKATFKANRAIRAGEELTIAYCDIAQGGDVGVWWRRLLEDFGFVCNCERREEAGGGGDNVTAADLLQPPPPLSPSAVPEPEPEPGGGGDDADPAADSDDGVSRTEEQQHLFDAAMRIHKEKFGHRGGWWHPLLLLAVLVLAAVMMMRAVVVSHLLAARRTVGAKGRPTQVLAIGHSQIAAAKQESLSRSRQSHRRSGSSYNSSSNSSSSSGNQ